MIDLVGIRFKPVGKITFYHNDNLEYNLDDNVIAETSRGIEFGQIVVKQSINESEKSDFNIVEKKLVRKATEEDAVRHQNNKQMAGDAFRICQNKIAEHKLNMKLIDAEYTFDAGKILFYFTADGRIDFRELVKSLASIFHTRIELRQIGARDEAKSLGGVGICGRVLCCRSFLGDFVPVSIRMAKEQNLPLNPTKISGSCGRLMCCLKYEQDTYEALLSHIAKVGSIVKTADGKGVVVDNNVISNTVKIHLDKDLPEITHTYKAKDVTVLKEGAPQQNDEPALKDLE